MKKAIHFIFIGVVLLSIASCGGGKNTASQADAGEDQRAALGTNITLDGSGSFDEDGDPINYRWEFTDVPGGSAATLISVNSATPQFTADVIGVYNIELTVDDGRDGSSDQVTVTVDHINVFASDFHEELPASLIVGQVGSGVVSVESEQLRLNSGEGFLNRAYVALNLTTLQEEYSGVLDNLTGVLSISFNLSNVDGAICGACNNEFSALLYSQPDPAASNGFGYALVGGGYVGDRMTFGRQAAAFAPDGTVQEYLLDMPNGLGNLPSIGAFRLEYDGVSKTWLVYFQASTSVADATQIQDLVGEFSSPEFLENNLPYLVFGSQQTDSVYIDNLTVRINFDI